MNIGRHWILMLMACTFLLSACKNNDAYFTIRGKLKNGEGKTIYFQNFIGNTVNTLDSALVSQNEEFEIKYPKPKLDFYQISLSPQNKLILILDSLDEPYIEANADNLFKSFAVTGSQQSEILLNYFREADKYETERSKLAQAYKTITSGADTSGQIKLQNLIFDFNKRYYGYLTNFIEQNSSSLAALSAIEKLNIQHDLKYYKKVYAELYKVIPNSHHLTALSQKITSAEKNIALAQKETERRKKLDSLIGVGKPAPNISLNNTQGKPTTLSSLRGKIVLLDFWASWCGPCRKENPNVKKVYNKYHKKGFEIFAVSLDTDKAKWEKAITDDGLPWIHVSDLAGWNSAAALKYGIESIPYTLLLDKNGDILAKNLRGANLEKKLDELFN